ncbi:MAG: metal ABC transporter substrate-binding protein [Pseudomonadota bacterium]
MRKLIVWTCLAIGLATGALAQDKPRVVAVNYPLHYFAERILGDAVEVAFPVPEGVDPSFWRPSISDISDIQSADLILLNGAGFAAWIDRVSLPRSKIVNTSAGFKDSYIATETITHSHGDGGEHSHEGTATYTWLDPDLAALQAESIATAAVARGLVAEADIAPRLAALRAELEALDAEATAAVADLQDTILIATHPRYQYFARAYGVTIRSLEWEAGAAPTADQLATLEALATETGARVLIWESQPPAEALEATAALGLRNVVFDPLANTVPGTDLLRAYSDSLTALSDVPRN